MNAEQSRVANILARAKPEKHAYANAVMDSQTCPGSAKVDASTWAEWAAYDEWMVVVTKFAWAYKVGDKNFNYEAFMEATGYNA